MTLLAEPILSVDVADRYAVRDPADIRAYVAARPHIAPFLEEAPDQIAVYFPDAPLTLEYQIDPDDGRELLILRVQTNQEPQAALAALTQLDTWYLDLPQDVQRDALVTLGEQ